MELTTHNLDGSYSSTDTQDIVLYFVKTPAQCRKQPMPTSCELRCGLARHGTAWHSMAWHGTAWHSMACHGTAWRSMACPAPVAEPYLMLSWLAEAGMRRAWHLPAPWFPTASNARSPPPAARLPACPPTHVPARRCVGQSCEYVILPDSVGDDPPPYAPPKPRFCSRNEAGCVLICGPDSTNCEWLRVVGSAADRSPAPSPKPCRGRACLH